MLIPCEDRRKRLLETGRSWLLRQPFLVGALVMLTAGLAVAATLLVLFPGFAGWLGSANYVDIARHLAADGAYSADGQTATLGRMPVMPWLLAALMWIFGDAWRWAALGVQLLALAACGGLSVRLIHRVSGGDALQTGLVAALLAAHALFSVEMLAWRETVWFTLELLLVADLLTRPDWTWRRGLALGLLAGAAYLTRPNGFVVGLLVPAAILCWPGVPRRVRAGATVLAVLAVLTAVTYWQIWAVAVTGRPVVSTTGGGLNLLKGARPEFWEIGPWADMDLLDPLLRAEAAQAGFVSEGEVDRYQWSVGQAEILRDLPGAVTRGGYKIALLFSPVFVPLGEARLVQQAGAWKLADYRFDPLALVCVPVVLLLLAGAGGRLVGRRYRAAGDRALGGFTLALTLALAATHALTFGETRYRLPLDPLLAVCAAPVLAAWWRARKTATAN